MSLSKFSPPVKETEVFLLGVSSTTPHKSQNTLLCPSHHVSHLQIFHPEHLITSSNTTKTWCPTSATHCCLSLFHCKCSSQGGSQSMDILISAIIGDLVSRSASFVINKYFQQQPGIDKIHHRLERVLLRIHTVVEEAEGRHITNQGMLRQLKMLRQGMYRGCYVRDALRYQAALDEVEGEKEMTHTPSALCKSSAAKRLRSSRTRAGSSNRESLLFGINSNMREELQRMVDALEDTMAGIKEFLFFLELYPRIFRQPYGTYLILDNCMFGRQTEREHVLNFLLCPNATSNLAVLPIIGPIRVGKSTLVEYVCRDESVRDHFSKILFFPEGSLKDERVIDLLMIKPVGIVIQSVIPPRS